MSDFMSGGLGDKAKDLASEHGDTVGDFVDEKTGGKYSDQIDQVQEHLGVQDSGAEQAEQAPQSQSGSEYGGQQAAEAGMGGQAPQEGSEFGQQAQGGSELGQQAQGESGLDREQAAAQQAEQYGDQAAGTEYGETVAGQPEGFGGEQSDETAQGGSQFGGESQSGF